MIGAGTHIDIAHGLVEGLIEAELVLLHIFGQVDPLFGLVQAHYAVHHLDDIALCAPLLVCVERPLPDTHRDPCALRHGIFLWLGRPRRGPARCGRQRPHRAVLPRCGAIASASLFLLAPLALEILLLALAVLARLARLLLELTFTLAQLLLLDRPIVRHLHHPKVIRRAAAAAAATAAAATTATATATAICLAIARVDDQLKHPLAVGDIVHPQAVQVLQRQQREGRRVDPKLVEKVPVLAEPCAVPCINHASAEDDRQFAMLCSALLCSVCLSVWLAGWLAGGLSLSMCPSVRLIVYLSVDLPACPSVWHWHSEIHHRDRPATGRCTLLGELPGHPNTATDRQTDGRTH